MIAVTPREVPALLWLNSGNFGGGNGYKAAPEEVNLMYRRLAFLLALSLFASACGSSNDPPASSGSLSGNWLISMTKTGKTTVSHTQSGSLLQNGNAVTGNLMFTDIPCSGVGSANGAVSGTAISLTVNPVGTAITLSGSISSATGQPPMSGTYTILSTGCVGPQSAPETGTFTASLVTPLNGNIAGTLVSNKGVTSGVTGKVSQGANTGSSSTSLTGSLTFTNFCYANANIVGSISGTSVVMNLVNSDGTQIGQLFGTTPLDSSSVTGTYQYFGLGTGASKACVDGDTGAATLTIAAQ